MNRSKLAIILVVTGVILWIGETWYFGWNIQPQSPAEMFLDMVAWGMILIGLVIKPMGETYNIHASEFKLVSNKDITVKENG